VDICLVDLDLELSIALAVHWSAGLFVLDFFSAIDLPAIGPCVLVSIKRLRLIYAHTAAVGSCIRSSAADWSPDLRVATVRFLCGDKIS
jgi:hypothetical protein